MPSYEAQWSEFEGLDALVLGVSIDHVPCLKAWAESLGGIHYPLLSDFWPHGAVAEKYGVFRDDGRSERAIFIIDKEGIVRYIDIHDIDDQPDNDEVLAELRRIDPQTAARAVAAELEAAGLPTGDVIMYCTSWCPACRRARRFLEERGVAYAEIDINAYPEARPRLRELTGGVLTTPTFDIRGEIVVDFKQEQRERLEEILGPGE
jgi:glutaredoxin